MADDRTEGNHEGTKTRRQPQRKFKLFTLLSGLLRAFVSSWLYSLVFGASPLPRPRVFPERRPRVVQALRDEAADGFGGASGDPQHRAVLQRTGGCDERGAALYGHLAHAFEQVCRGRGERGADEEDRGEAVEAAHARRDGGAIRFVLQQQGVAGDAGGGDVDAGVGAVVVEGPALAAGAAAAGEPVDEQQRRRRGEAEVQPLAVARAGEAGERVGHDGEDGVVAERRVERL